MKPHAQELRAFHTLAVQHGQTDDAALLLHLCKRRACQDAHAEELRDFEYLALLAEDWYSYRFLRATLEANA